MAMILLRGRAYLDTHRLVAGEWPREELGRGVELAGKRLGIIGLGSIGSHHGAQGARAWRCACSPAIPICPTATSTGTSPRGCRWDELLDTCDVFTIHCPLNNETRGMIARARAGAHEEGRGADQLGARRHR